MKQTKGSGFISIYMIWHVACRGPRQLLACWGMPNCSSLRKVAPKSGLPWLQHHHRPRRQSPASLSYLSHCNSRNLQSWVESDSPELACSYLYTSHSLCPSWTQKPSPQFPSFLASYSQLPCSRQLKSLAAPSDKESILHMTSKAADVKCLQFQKHHVSSRSKVRKDLISSMSEHSPCVSWQALKHHLIIRVPTHLV